MVLIAVLGAATIRDSEAPEGWASDAVLVGAGVGVVFLGWIVGRWMRRRQRRRILGMRDSALW